MSSKLTNRAVLATMDELVGSPEKRDVFRDRLTDLVSKDDATPYSALSIGLEEHIADSVARAKKGANWLTKFSFDRVERFAKVGPTRGILLLRAAHAKLAENIDEAPREEIMKALSPIGHHLFLLTRNESRVSMGATLTLMNLQGQPTAYALHQIDEAGKATMELTADGTYTYGVPNDPFEFYQEDGQPRLRLPDVLTDSGTNYCPAGNHHVDEELGGLMVLTSVIQDVAVDSIFTRTIDIT